MNQDNVQRTVSQSGGRRKEYGPVTVDEIRDSAFSDSYQQAQLRQQVRHVYPSTQFGNEKMDNPFADDAPEGQSFTEQRVVWIKVPNGTTKEDVESQLAECPEPTIYKELATDVAYLWTEADRNILQRTRDEEGEEALRAEMKRRAFGTDGSGGFAVRDDDGNLVKYGANDKVVFSRLFFKKDFHPDIDYRGEEDQEQQEAVTEEPATTETAEEIEDEVLNSIEL